MYYILNDKKVVICNEIDHPSYVPLTEGQIAYYLRYPNSPISSIKNYTGDGSDLDRVYNQNQVSISLEDIKLRAKKDLSAYSRETLGKSVDNLGFCNALASSIFSSERGLDSIYSNEEVLATFDNFLTIGKSCRDKYHESVQLIDDALTIEEVNDITNRAISSFDSYISNINDLESHKRAKLREIDCYDVSEYVNGFFLNGTLMWLDKASRSGLVNTLHSSTLAGRETINIWFKGIYIALPINQAEQLLASLELYATDCYNVTAQHKVIVSELQTIEEVDKFDVTLGYPNRLEFNLSE